MPQCCVSSDAFSFEFKHSVDAFPTFSWQAMAAAQDEFTALPSTAERISALEEKVEELEARTSVCVQSKLRRDTHADCAVSCLTSWFV